MAEIADLLSCIRIDEPDRSDLVECMCCGEPTLEFYRGERLLVSLGMHHGFRLRWPRGCFLGDQELTPDSREALTHWLARRGVPGLLKELHPLEETPADHRLY